MFSSGPDPCQLIICQAMKEAEKEHGITKIDIVSSDQFYTGVISDFQAIANAAIGDSFYPLAKVPLSNFEEHWRINVKHYLQGLQYSVKLI